MSTTTEITGTYGSHQTPCTIFTYGGWYAIEGSRNVNHVCPSLLIDGVDVESLEDCDSFHWSIPIDSEEELAKAVEA